MNKIRQRTAAVLALVGLLILGIILFLGRYLQNGANWAAFPVNGHAFTNGVLTSGTILDRSGTVLSTVTDGKRTFSESKTIRRAVLHAVGDAQGNIGTGALTKYKTLLMGYNPVTGLYSPSGEGNTLYLTIDADVCAQAYKALDGRNGAILVYNYKTGAILCMVSAPGFDPEKPPNLKDGEKGYEGIYINKTLSSRFTPGSIFKLVTTAAAVENLPDLEQLQFTCEGSATIAGEKINCEGTHGTIGINDALAVSCNAYFAELSQKLGGALIQKYADQFGLTSNQTVDGVKTAAGRFDVAADGSAYLSWSGIGQYNDLVNPCAMMTLMGAIANNGSAVAPRILQKAMSPSGLPVGLWISGSKRLMKAETAKALTDMMSYNVTSIYGEKNFPGLDICAKSGTAQVGAGKKPHAWFVGFLRNDAYPYAFAVLVENGGSGRSVAGSVANRVLQTAVKTANADAADSEKKK